jgi:hypothetical protein
MASLNSACSVNFLWASTDSSSHRNRKCSNSRFETAWSYFTVVLFVSEGVQSWCQCTFVRVSTSGVRTPGVLLYNSPHDSSEAPVPILPRPLRLALLSSFGHRLLRHECSRLRQLEVAWVCAPFRLLDRDLAQLRCLFRFGYSNASSLAAYGSFTLTLKKMV